MGNLNDEIKPETVYGLTCTSASFHALIVMPKPTPLQVAQGIALELLFGVVVPALLFAIAWAILTAR